MHTNIVPRAAALTAVRPLARRASAARPMTAAFAVIAFLTMAIFAAPVRADVFYAAPNGSAASACSDGDPCDLETAISRANAEGRTNDEVILQLIGDPEQNPYIIGETTALDGVTRVKGLEVRPGVTVTGEVGPNNARPVIQAAFGSEDAEAIEIDNFVGSGLQLFYDNWTINKGIFNVESANNNVFQNLVLDGRRYSQRDNADFGASAGIRMRTPNRDEDFRNPGHPDEGHLTVTNSQFRNIRGAGVFIFGGQGHTVNGCDFVSCGYAEGDTPGGLVNDASSGAITFQMVQNSNFHDNTFASFARSEGFGIKMGGTFNESLRIYGNVFNLFDTQPYNSGDPNFDIELISARHSDIEVYGNYFQGTLSLVLGEPGRMIFNVHDNHWTNINGTNGDQLDWAIELGADRSIIANNNFEGSGRFLTSFGGTDNVTVTGNIIEGAGAFAYIGGAYTNFTVTNNLIRLTDRSGLGEVQGPPTKFIDSTVFIGGPGGSNWTVTGNVITPPAGATRTVFTIGNGKELPANLTLENYDGLDLVGFSDLL